jgi:hypothetical protein
MQVTLETLGALERRFDLTVPAADIDKEVTARLAKMARTVRMPGFRQGKVPMKMVAASYGAQVQAEVLNDKVGAVFNEAVSSHKLRVAGTPRLEPKAGESKDLAFTATFEVFPEVKLGDLSAIEVRRAVCAVGDEQIDRTIEVMRKQRATFEAVDRTAGTGDRLRDSGVLPEGSRVGRAHVDQHLREQHQRTRDLGEVGGELLVGDAAHPDVLLVAPHPVAFSDVRTVGKIKPVGSFLAFGEWLFTYRCDGCTEDCTDVFTSFAACSCTNSERCCYHCSRFGKITGGKN